VPDSVGVTRDPLISSHFLLEVDGVEIGSFSEISGLELTVAVETYAEGGENGYVHRLPGRMSWPNLVFRRGITDSNALFDWMGRTAGAGFEGAGNKLTRSTAAVTVMGADKKRIRAWEIEGAFPVRWSGPRLSSSSIESLEEELEIAHHGFRTKTFSG
jgi:phage tail-like protein